MRMVQPILEVKASTPQESPDIVILAGHSCLQHYALGEETTLTLFLGYAQRIQGLGSISIFV